MALWTLAEHADTRAFYLKEGFAVVPHEHRKHDGGALLVRFRADL